MASRSENVAANILPASDMNGASTIGRLSSSFLCDRFGALRVHFTVALVSSFLCLFLWTFAKNLPTALVFVVLFGAFSGSLIGLPPASMAYILGPSAQHRLGQWTGLMYSMAAPFALTGPVIEGYLITRYGQNYLTLQLFSGFCLFMAACCMFMSMDEPFFRRKRAGDEDVRGLERKSRLGSIGSALSAPAGWFRKDET